MADDNLFLIRLVTPERILVTGQAAEVILRTGEGDATFLAGHTPLVGTVEPGVVRVVLPEGDEVRLAVHGGFVQVEQVTKPESDGKAAGASPTGTEVTILVGVAELAEEIDTERARAALEAAEARLSELGGAGGRTAGGSGTSGEGDEVDPEVVDAEAALLRAQVRLEAVDATAGATAGATAASAG
jgi:F-type H+-transporting ATPase subunit epsilon